MGYYADILKDSGSCKSSFHFSALLCMYMHMLTFLDLSLENPRLKKVNYLIIIYPFILCHWSICSLGRRWPCIYNHTGQNSQFSSQSFLALSTCHSRSLHLLLGLDISVPWAKTYPPQIGTNIQWLKNAVKTHICITNALSKTFKYTKPPKAWNLKIRSSSPKFEWIIVRLIISTITELFESLFTLVIKPECP